MKRVLGKGNLVISRTFWPDGSGSGMIKIIDLQTNTHLHIYPEEAEYLSNALKELLEFTSSNPPPDQL